MKTKTTRPAYAVIKKEATDLMIYRSAGVAYAVAIVSRKYGFTPAEALGLMNDIKATF